AEVPGGAASRAALVRLQGDALSWAPLPAFEHPLQAAQATLAGDDLVVAGVGANGQPVLQRLALKGEAGAWTSMPLPPSGAPLSLVGQGAVLLASAPGAAGGERLYAWRPRTGWTEASTVPGGIAPGSGRAIGQAHVLYLLQEADPSRPLRAATYHTITRSWATVPGFAPVAGGVPVAAGDGLAWIAPNADGNGHAVSRVVFESPGLMLRWLDWSIIFVYLASMVGIGGYFYLREKRNSTDSFFVGGRSIPFWAAGVSLYATNVSSISFIAIPAKAFETNWTYLANNLIAVVGLMFVAVWIVPLLRRLDLMSVFSYLETRFHPGIRMIASALCIVTQIGSRMSIILFLPALAIATITGIDVVWSILMMGVFTIIYTTLGGMKAVIWTDFVQVFVMFGGAIFAIVFVLLQIDGDAGQAITAAMAEDKTKLFDFSFDLTQATVWGFVFLVFFDVVLTFPKDQVLMQRVLSTKSDKEAGRSVWTFAAIMIPGGFFFYAIGTALWMFYREHPERLNPTLPIDATFPLFIAAELPMGVTGLIIAGIFAAAMSTLSSIINSVSTLVSVDFYEKIAKNPTPQKSVRFAEWTGVVVGLLGIVIAIVLSRFDIRSLFDVSIELVGLLGGGFAGAYTLGMFTRRANSQGVAIGIGAALVLTFVIWTFQLVHPYYYLAISIFICIVVGYLASLFFPAPTRSLDGLTIYRDARTSVATG
ncbi:MAG: sodium:solute symporter, partial [Pseudomonadota bacterium]